MEVVGENLLVFLLAENPRTDLVHLVADRLAGRPRTGHVLQLLTHPRLRKPFSGLLLAMLGNHLRVLRRRDVFPGLPRRPPETAAASEPDTVTAEDLLAGRRQVTRRVQIVSEPRQRCSRQLLVRQPSSVIPPLQQFLMECGALSAQPSKRFR